MTFIRLDDSSEDKSKVYKKTFPILCFFKMANKNTKYNLYEYTGKNSAVKIIEPSNINRLFQQVSHDELYNPLSILEKTLPRYFYLFERIKLSDTYNPQENFLRKKYALEYSKNLYNKDSQNNLNLIRAYTNVLNEIQNVHALCGRKKNEKGCTIYKNSHLSKKEVLQNLFNWLLHELGHIIWENLSKEKKDEYIKAYFDDISENFIGGFNIHAETSYGKNYDSFEDFPFSLKNCIKFDQQFQVSAPNRYSFISKIL